MIRLVLVIGVVWVFMNSVGAQTPAEISVVIPPSLPRLPKIAEPIDAPPLALQPLPPPRVETLPGGVIVSQTMGELLPSAVEPIPVRPGEYTVIGVSPEEYRHRIRADLLVWWSSGAPTPPLLTGNRIGQSPSLGTSGTQLLLGGQRLSLPALPGFLLDWERQLTSIPQAKLSMGFFSSGTVDSRLTTSTLSSAVWPVLARPIFNPSTGQEDFVYIRHPQMSGDLQAYANSRIEGSHISLLYPVYNSSSYMLNARLGLRSISLNEGLRVEQRSIFRQSVNGQPTGDPTQTISSDQIHTCNDFGGVYLGLQNTMNLSILFLEWDSRVSLGANRAGVRRDGATVTTRNGANGVTQTVNPYGVFVQSTNRGLIERNLFSVVPEAELRCGLAITPKSRLFLGYHLIWMSDVVRPGDQVDRVIELGSTNPPPNSGRPLPTMVMSDYWIQGLTVGFEWRY